MQSWTRRAGAPRQARSGRDASRSTAMSCSHLHHVSRVVQMVRRVARRTAPALRVVTLAPPPPRALLSPTAAAAPRAGRRLGRHLRPRRGAHAFVGVIANALASGEQRARGGQRLGVPRPMGAHHGREMRSSLGHAPTVTFPAFAKITTITRTPRHLRSVGRGCVLRARTLRLEGGSCSGKPSAHRHASQTRGFIV